MYLRFLVLLSCVVTVQCIGEKLNMRTVVASASVGCGVYPNPDCPPIGTPDVPAVTKKLLDAAHIPPDWVCPCPTNGQPGGVFPQASGVPIVSNPDADYFLDQALIGGFNAPVAMSFTDDTNEMFLGERGGCIWRVDLGTMQKTLFYNVTDEVGYSGDRGIMDVRTSPNYQTSRTVIMQFTVNPLGPTSIFGEPNLESAANQRVIRVTDPGQGMADPATRVDLIGGGVNDGVPICFNTHALGGLRFGSDGSLMFTGGEGAHWNFDMGDWGQDAQNAYYSNAPSLDYQCAKLFGPEQDIGSWRAQVLYSLGGKINRIDPETGEGICPGSKNAAKYTVMNPYCDNTNGKSFQSKIWGRGFRQPFRMTMRPFNPATDTAPGVFYVGDVGQGGYEEINAVTGPGMNFGWPCWEGPMPMPTNRDSPYNDNGAAVFNQGCGSEQSACGPITSVALDEKGRRLTCPLMYHNYNTTMPFIFWTRYQQEQPANIYNYGEVYFTGQGFLGATTTGVAFYTGDKYPAKYKNQLFAVDYSNLWLNVFFGENDQFISSENFANLINTAGPKVTVEAGPDGNICYLTLTGGEVRCFIYQTGNTAPVPQPGAVDNSGIAPCTIQFQSDGTEDREHDLVSFFWDFGDGTTSTLANPTHTYTTARAWNVTLRATDNWGNTNIAQYQAYSNTKKPKITVASPTPNIPNAFVYTAGQPVNFTMVAETDANIVNWEWEYQFMHNYHFHPNIKVVNQQSFMDPQPPDEGALERNTLRIYARATDDKGLTGETWFLVVRPDWKTSFTPNHPPIPWFNWTGHSPLRVGQPITFDASGSVEPDQDYILYSWDWGDGMTGSGELTTHTFEAYSPFGYLVTLYTMDNFGASANMSLVINLQPDPSYSNSTFDCGGGPTCAPPESTIVSSDDGGTTQQNTGGTIVLPSDNPSSSENSNQSDSSVLAVGIFVTLIYVVSLL